MDTTSSYPARQEKWNDIWLEVWTHPGPQSFQSMFMQHDDNADRGLKWVAATAFIATLVNLVTVLLFTDGSRIGSLLIAMIIAPLMAMAGLAFSAGLYHLIAKIFGGKGTFGDLIYCFAIVQAPYYIISSLGSSMSVISSTLSTLIQILTLFLGIYVLVLNANAIQAVEKFGAWKTIAIMALPFVVFFILGLCLASGIPLTSG